MRGEEKRERGGGGRSGGQVVDRENERTAGNLRERSWPRWVRMRSRYGASVTFDAPSQKFTNAAAA